MGAPPVAALGAIRCVTFVCEDPARAEQAWCDHLAYRRAAAGRVDAAAAQAWGTPAAAGRAALVLAPAAAAGHYVRFIEGPVPADYQPFTTTGWNAAEILVRDCDALAGALADSPFEIIGPPADLSFTDAIRAMQVMGPAREILYLTEIKGAVPGFELPLARAAIEHCFVAITGGHDLESMKRWYRERFGLADAPAVPARLTVLSRALGLPLESRHNIAALALAPGYLVELDEFPPATKARAAAAPQELPPAMALVSFEHAGPLPAGAERYEAAFGTQRYTACCLKGPAGERIELLEIGVR